MNLRHEQTHSNVGFEIMICHTMHIGLRSHLQDPTSVTIANRIEEDLSTPVGKEDHCLKAH